MKKFLASRTPMEVILGIPMLIVGIASLVTSFADKRKPRNQRGASIVEYTLLVALVLVIVIVGYGALHQDKNDTVVHRRPATSRHVTTTTAIPQSCVSGTNGNVVVVEDAGCPATTSK